MAERTTAARRTGAKAAPVRRPNRRGPSLYELAEDWLTGRRVGERPDDPGNTDRAYRADLTRWARAILTVTGRPPEPEGPTGLELLDSVTVTELADAETLVRALDLLRPELAQRSRARMLSTMHGWCRWLVRRGVLAVDPTDGDEVRITAEPGTLDGKTFSPDDVDALYAAAHQPPRRATSAWPARDEAIVAVAATCGVRVSELCALTIRAVDRRYEIPLLRITAGAKGGKQRSIPIPSPTIGRVDRYLAERLVCRAESGQ